MLRVHLVGVVESQPSPGDVTVDNLTVVLSVHVPMFPYQLDDCLQFSITGANWMTKNFPHQVLLSSDPIRIVWVLCGQTDPGHVPGVGRVGRDGGADPYLIDWSGGKRIV